MLSVGLENAFLAFFTWYLISNHEEGGCSLNRKVSTYQSNRTVCVMSMNLC
jgi:hypothetical protein